MCTRGGQVGEKGGRRIVWADRRSGSDKREQTAVVVTSDMTASIAASTNMENIQAYCQLQKRKKVVG